MPKTGKTDTNVAWFARLGWSIGEYVDEALARRLQVATPRPEAHGLRLSDSLRQSLQPAENFFVVLPQ
jgi:hypothetical protein